MTKHQTSLHRTTMRVAIIAAAASLIGIAGTAPASAVDGGITVSSSDISNGAEINPLFACTSAAAGDGLLSPQLSWSAAPSAVRYVVIMHDEFGMNAGYDTADMDWTHWSAYNIGSGTTSLVRNASATTALGGGVHGLNTWGEFGMPGPGAQYRGPCPPAGAAHTYYFTVYAVNAVLAPTGTGPGGAVTTADLLLSMAGHVIDQGDLSVTFDPADVGTHRADLELAADTAGGESATAPLPVILVNGEVSAATTVQVTLGGTATAGTDYTGASPIAVTIPAGIYDGTAATAIAIPGVAILDDAVVESTETLTFALSGPTGDGVLADSNHNGTARASATRSITDNDVAPPVGGGGAPAVTAPPLLAKSGYSAPTAAAPIATLLLASGVWVLIAGRRRQKSAR